MAAAYQAFEGTLSPPSSSDEMTAGRGRLDAAVREAPDAFDIGSHHLRGGSAAVNASTTEPLCARPRRQVVVAASSRR
ncbi:hypothetical protein Ae406Ps2_0533 [Pseudonocardia sp. Ae406_Ps2]|nr:hypothetical protein Ae406Ps2_0533 [Pseudonocardia sp. Ae406_Ps2]OLM07676.1 hypothetical protein Ae331Ps2_5386c [Pseudonocardia sp. Ae331_Ps2]OLM22105.1 hypothetical protein Ae706Ps2_0537 [Pseudonocardia sp. Ae706_Ps2]